MAWNLSVPKDVYLILSVNYSTEINWMLMSKSGRMFFYDQKGKLTKVIEPINEFPDRNADWDNGIDKKNMPEFGSIKENESIITEANGFKNIRYVKGGTDNFV